MTLIVMSNLEQLDTALLNEDEIARKIWEHGLKDAQEFVKLKQALPFDNLSIQVAGDLERANLLYQGTILDFDKYHPQPWRPHADFNGLIQGNQTLFKIISSWREFLQQITDFKVRPCLRTGKDPTATHKLDLTTNTIIPYQGKRRIKTQYDKTKKQSATLLSKNLHTGVFGYGGVGILFDEKKCDIRARFETNAMTFYRGWIGDYASIQKFQTQATHGLSGQSKLHTNPVAFRNYVDLPTSISHNEVLAKFSRESILGVFVKGDMQVYGPEAIKCQQDLMSLFNNTIDFPIFVYDNTAHSIRVYTKQEQADKLAGQNSIAHDQQQLMQSITTAIQSGDIVALQQAFTNSPTLVRRGLWLLDAMKSKQWQVFTYLLTLSDIDKNQKSVNKNETPLILAIHLNNIVVAEELLQSGANINEQDDDGQTAVMRSILKDKTDYLNLLVKHTPDFSVISKNNDSALSLAIKNFNVDMIEILLNHGCNVDQLDGNKQPPLALAVEYDYGDVVQLLIKSGADVNLPQANGETPLMMAVRQRNKDLVKLLSEASADATLKNGSGDTPLMSATKSADIETVRCLLKNSANPGIDIPNITGETPLMVAVKLGNTPLVKLLAKASADATLINTSKETALMYATKASDITSVRCLLENSANPGIDITNTTGDTPLMVAVKLRYTALVQLLVKASADATLKDSKDDTPLMFASRNGLLDIVKCLLESSAPGLNCTDKEGNQALMLASQHGHLEIVSLLKDKIDVNQTNNDIDSAFTLAIKGQHQTIVDDLISQANLEQPCTGNKRTPLMVAARLSKSTATVASLLRAGADPNTLDNNLENALMHAVKSECKENVKQLLSTGKYNLKHENKEKKTAVDIAIAVEFQKQKSPGVLEVLLLHAANLEDEKELVLGKKSETQLQTIFIDLFHQNQIEGMMAFLLMDLYKMIHRFDPQYTEAIAAAKEIHATLKTAFITYQQSHKTEKDLNTLFRKWSEVVENAKSKSALADHRGLLKNALVHISLFLCTGPVGHIILALTAAFKNNSQVFFAPTNTKAVNQLESIQKKIDTMRPTKPRTQ